MPEKAIAATVPADLLEPAIGSSETVFPKISVDDLKGKSVRGGAAALLSQGLKFVLQTGAMMLLARLLSPEDFGLQGMVVAVTGIVGLFKDAGLSVATVQRETITHSQVSTLFWINLAIGAALNAITAAIAPLLVTFYKEPRLLWLTIISGAAFTLNGLAVQHQALLQRSMRYITLAKIEVFSLGVSSFVAIAIALMHGGYWALVGMAITGPIATAVACWLAYPWMPGRPKRHCGIRSMLQFGGTVTFNSLVVYIAYNTEKILLGRFWGAEVLGLYGRAYQLANLPLQQLNSSIYGVAFPALSRIQHDSERLCRSFLKGYAILLSVTLPVTVCCAVFAEEIVRVLLGKQWISATPLFRLLVPTVLSFALINPFGWFLIASGRARRSLNMAYVIAPAVILGTTAGLPFGATGVAIGFSTAMTILIIPLICWAIHGTEVTPRLYWLSTRPAIVSGLVAGLLAWLLKLWLNPLMSFAPRLLVGTAFLFRIYGFFLLFVMKQKPLYMDLIQQVFRRSPRVSQPS